MDLSAWGIWAAAWRPIWSIEALGEAASLTVAYGVDPAELFKIVTGTLFAAPAYKTCQDHRQTKVHARRFQAHPWAEGCALGPSGGESEHMLLPIASVLRDQFIQAIAHSDSEKDWAALAASALRSAGRKL